MEKINGDIRIVAYMIVLNDLIEKDPFKIRNLCEIFYTTKGLLVLYVMNLKKGFTL